MHIVCVIKMEYYLYSLEWNRSNIKNDNEGFWDQADDELLLEYLKIKKEDGFDHSESLTQGDVTACVHSIRRH